MTRTCYKAYPITNSIGSAAVWVAMCAEYSCMWLLSYSVRMALDPIYGPEGTLVDPMANLQDLIKPITWFDENWPSCWWATAYSKYRTTSFRSWTAFSMLDELWPWHRPSATMIIPINLIWGQSALRLLGYGVHKAHDLTLWSMAFLVGPSTVCNGMGDLIIVILHTCS